MVFLSPELSAQNYVETVSNTIIQGWPLALQTHFQRHFEDLLPFVVLYVLYNCITYELLACPPPNFDERPRVEFTICLSQVSVFSAHHVKTSKYSVVGNFVPCFQFPWCGHSIVSEHLLPEFGVPQTSQAEAIQTTQRRSMLQWLVHSQSCR